MESPIPERSAPILTAFAAKSEIQKRLSMALENFFESALPRPAPVTIPIRAHINWTAAIIGQVNQAIQSREVPSCAPAIE